MVRSNGDGTWWPRFEITMNIFDKAEAVASHAQFVEFTDALLKDFIENHDEWENIKLDHFLECIAAWARSMEVVYRNAGQNLGAAVAVAADDGSAVGRANLRMTH